MEPNHLRDAISFICTSRLAIPCRARATPVVARPAGEQAA
jgi:hypothetical protein